MTKNWDDYDEKYIKIKFNSDEELPLNKTIENQLTTIVVRAVFLDECLINYENVNYDRINVSEGIDINKWYETSVTKACGIFHYWYYWQWWWWLWIVFMVWLTNERCLVLFPAGTIVWDRHHCESPTRCEQDEWSCDNHYTTTPRLKL